MVFPVHHLTPVTFAERFCAAEAPRRSRLLPARLAFGAAQPAPRSPRVSAPVAASKAPAGWHRALWKLRAKGLESTPMPKKCLGPKPPGKEWKPKSCKVEAGVKK